MARAKGPRHVLELPLSVDERARHILERRFSAANTLRNGILQSGLKALDACREDPSWEAARSLPRKTKHERAARAQAFADVRVRCGLTEAALCVVERTMRESCWIRDHITARLGHVIVKEVLKSIENNLFLGRGRPRFRRADDCRTISARQASPMILKGDPSTGLTLKWTGLSLPVRRKVFSASELHSLACLAIHCRVKRIPSGRVAPASPWRYAVQIIVAGKSCQHRERATSGVAGVDMGPAMAGVVWRNGEDGAGHRLVPLAAEVEGDETNIRRMQRSQDRQRRTVNPHCFDERGRWKKGQRIRHQSNRHKREMARRRVRETKAAKHRRNCHGRDTNDILAVASEIRIEDHGYSGWSRLWGRAMGRGMPGLFITELRRKCLDTGGTFVSINTRKAALSQVDALGGIREKKPLRQRWHELGDGSGFIQRDLHSALLASHCDAEGRIDQAGVRAHLQGPCQDLVQPSAAKAAAMAEAARARALPAPRSKDRQSGSNGSREVPAMREKGSRRQRRRDWLRGRITTRRTRRNGSANVAPFQIACVTLSPASFRV
tara:strand:+ start:4873 stop:6528 length:1656 start_codon:yes stop_codon:yes gene_type:complete